MLLWFQIAETPLHIAARVDDGEKCAEILIKSGADSNASQQVSALEASSSSLSVTVVLLHQIEQYINNIIRRNAPFIS